MTPLPLECWLYGYGPTLCRTNQGRTQKFGKGGPPPNIPKRGGPRHVRRGSGIEPQAPPQKLTALYNGARGGWSRSGLGPSPGLGLEDLDLSPILCGLGLDLDLDLKIDRGLGLGLGLEQKDLGLKASPSSPDTLKHTF